MVAIITTLNRNILSIRKYDVYNSIFRYSLFCKIYSNKFPTQPFPTGIICYAIPLILFWIQIFSKITQLTLVSVWRDNNIKMGDNIQTNTKKINYIHRSLSSLNLSGDAWRMDGMMHIIRSNCIHLSILSSS